MMLLVLIMAVQHSRAQPGFKRASDSMRSLQENSRRPPQSNQSRATNTLNRDEKAYQQLIHDYDRLPERVRQQMASNKAGGHPIGMGIRKYYLLSVSFANGTREAAQLETAIRSLAGFVSLVWVKEGVLQLHVETVVQSEQIKEKLQKINSLAAVEEEQYYAY